MTKPVVYWRPGCGYCTALMREIEQDNFEVELVNIWEDPAAAAIVRKHNNGNEVVPTVVIGEKVLINPYLKLIKDAMA